MAALTLYAPAWHMQLPQGLAKKLFVPRIMISRGIVPPLRPDQLLKVLTIRKHFGSTAATGYAVAALRNPDSEAIVDEAGTLTFRQVHERTNALAHALSDHGILEGDRVAIMCRNHRGFIESAVACAKLGANIIYLNTAFAGPQLADVVRREQPVALIYDQEFTGLMAEASEGMRCFISWVDDRDASRPADARRPDRQGRPDRRRRAVRARPRRHPHLGHDRHAEGGVAQARRTPHCRPRSCSTRSRCPARGER